MAVKHLTMRGVPFDMNKLRSSNAHKPALGNASKNARGDKIDTKGVVLKTQEQINAEWENNRRVNEESVRTVSIQDDLNKLIPVTNKPVKQIVVDDQNFDPEIISNSETPPVQHKSKRKIIDAE